MPEQGRHPLPGHLHPRAGAPPSQDDAVEQGRARRIRPAADERAEGTVAVYHLVQGLESSDVPVDAPLSPEHLATNEPRRPSPEKPSKRPKNGVGGSSQEAGRPTS